MDLEGYGSITLRSINRKGLRSICVEAFNSSFLSFFFLLSISIYTWNICSYAGEGSRRIEIDSSKISVDMQLRTLAGRVLQSNWSISAISLPDAINRSKDLLKYKASIQWTFADGLKRTKGLMFGHDTTITREFSGSTVLDRHELWFGQISSCGYQSRPTFADASWGEYQRIGRIAIHSAESTAPASQCQTPAIIFSNPQNPDKTYCIWDASTGRDYAAKEFFNPAKVDWKREGTRMANIGAPHLHTALRFGMLIT